MSIEDMLRAELRATLGRMMMADRARTDTAIGILRPYPKMPAPGVILRSPAWVYAAFAPEFETAKRAYDYWDTCQGVTFDGPAR